MVYRPRRSCRRCGVDRDAAGGVSHSGLCRECGPIVAAEALEQLAGHHGPHYRAYLEGLTEYVSRLWGEMVTPDSLAELVDQDSSEEAQTWPVGSRT